MFILKIRIQKLSLLPQSDALEPGTHIPEHKALPVYEKQQQPKHTHKSVKYNFSTETSRQI